MSTLLKKKYCEEWRKNMLEDEPCVDTESDVGSCSIESVKVNAAVVEKSAMPLPVSPPSISVSIDEECTGNVRQLSRPLPKAPLVLKSGYSWSDNKSVRFDVVNSVLIDHDYAETVYKYRADIWYTREEYRTFWNDRMNSVRLWKCMFNGCDVMRSNGAFGEYNSDYIWEGNDYTVRGLENYIFSSSEKLNRQRDLYTVAVLQDPYNSDGTLTKVCDLSMAALQRAQLYALYDAAGVNEDNAKVASSQRSSDDHMTWRRIPTSPRSPSSVIPTNYIYGNDVKTAGTHLSIREMNKRLIETISRENAPQDLILGSRKCQKRRSSTTRSGREVNKQHDKITSSQRRHSTSFSMINHRQPVSIHLQQSPRVEQPQRQRPTLREDFNQHMQFCNRLLNDLPVVNHDLFHRRDSLSLAGSMIVLPHHTVSCSGINRGNNTDGSYNDESILSDRFRLNANQYQLLLKQQRTPLYDSLNEDYASCIRSYSRLRRDSLAGNFSMSG